MQSTLSQKRGYTYGVFAEVVLFVHGLVVFVDSDCFGFVDIVVSDCFFQRLVDFVVSSYFPFLCYVDFATHFVVHS